MIRIIIILFFSLNLFAKSRVIGEYKTVSVKSVRSNQQRLYYLVQPGRSIKLKLSQNTGLYIRALIENKNIPSYYYKIISKGYEKTYKRKVKISKKVIGLKGEKLSVLSKVYPKSDFVILRNISDIPLLVRIYDKFAKVKFVSVSPSLYGAVYKINRDNSKITYYQVKDGKILLKVHGKAIVKIISRTVKGKDYFYSVFDNDKLKFTEKIKFKKSKLFKERFISKGTVKYFEFSKGEHILKIQADKDVIFRFFIDKKAVRLIK